MSLHAHSHRSPSQVTDTNSVADSLTRFRMKAIDFKICGKPEVLTLKDVKIPFISNHEVLIRVTATTVNRMDLRRRNGSLKPATANRYLGLECSGIIAKVGALVYDWKVGDEVCALLASGGYCEFVVVSQSYIISAPKSLPLSHAAALPCAASIVYLSFFLKHKLTCGQKVLIHGGAGGVGTFAIQVAKYFKCIVFATAGSKLKEELCSVLGADICINYKEQNFANRVKIETGGAGVDVILDFVGTNFEKNMSSLARGGKLIFVGCEDDLHSANVDLVNLASRDIRIVGLNVRNLCPGDKVIVIKGLQKEFWPLIEQRNITPFIHTRIYKFSEAIEAHKLMEKNGNLGRILLIPDS